MPNDARLVLLDKDVVEPLFHEALDTGGIFGIKSGDVPAQKLLGFRPRLSGRAIEGSVESLTRPLSC